MTSSTRAIKKFFVLFALIKICSFSSFVFGETREIYFAGVAFTGSAEDASNVLRYTSELLSAEGLVQLNGQLSQSLLDSPPKNFNIVFDRLANIDYGSSALVLAATMDRETVIVEQIGDEYKLLVELAGQALFFDFREKQILSSYPVTVQYIDVSKERPGIEAINSILETILFDSGERSFVHLITKKLENINFPQAAVRRIRVASIEVGDSIKSEHPLLTKTLFDTGIIGHEFSKILSDKLNIAILPYRSGQALGGAMAARFANGDIFNLIIPEADYEIHLHVDDFRGRTLNETRSYRQELLGAFFRIDVIEPLSGRSFFDQNLKQGATKVIPATQKEFNVGEAYYETLLVGLAEFATSVAEGNEEWIAQQDEVRKLNRSFASLQELIELCR